MGINQFKTYALENMCTEHLWKVGDTSSFTLKGWEYTIEKIKGGKFSLSVNGNHYGCFSGLNRLFYSIFHDRWISFN